MSVALAVDLFRIITPSNQWHFEIIITDLHVIDASLNMQGVREEGLDWLLGCGKPHNSEARE